MNYYKDENNVVYQYNDIQIPRQELIKLIPEELELHLNPDKTPEQLQSDAKTHRDTITENNIELNSTGAIYQIDESARNTMNEVRTKAELEKIPLSTTRNWRLANNKWRETSLNDINTLILAYIDRKERIWQAFEMWDMGDKKEAFTYE